LRLQCVSAVTISGELKIVFLLDLAVAFSRFGNIKLGKDHEKPAFNDMTWFSLIFTCGIGIGLYFYGVSEPIYYYRLSYENKLFKVPFQNDDQRAQQAIFVVLYHWGFHAWSCYILVALTLGFVSFRWDMPMTLRIAFYPLVGDVVHGLFGDVLDFVAMACTTFGVCTSLGFGVDIILAGVRRVDCGAGATCESAIPASTDETGAFLTARVRSGCMLLQTRVQLCDKLLLYVTTGACFPRLSSSGSLRDARCFPSFSVSTRV
jgi:hypothetical protein